MNSPPQDSPRDTLYARVHTPLERFAFDAQVAGVFPDMIRRSVPGYAALTSLIGLLAAEHAQPNSRIYDLGCSLGAATLAVRRQLQQPDCRIIAIDSSPAMIAECRTHLAQDAEHASTGEPKQAADAPSVQTPVELICADIREVEFSRASVIIMNFTLQFIPPDARLALLQRIHRGLLPGGVLLLAEKLRFADAGQQETLNALHLAFKRANGYSELEISQKRSALEQVLIADTLEEHLARLQQAGFTQALPWFQALNFFALLARK